MKDGHSFCNLRFLKLSVVAATVRSVSFGIDGCDNNVLFEMQEQHREEGEDRKEAQSQHRECLVGTDRSVSVIAKGSKDN